MFSLSCFCPLITDILAFYFVDLYNPPGKEVPDVPPPITILAPPPIAPATPSLDELIQQSQGNLQQQEQHLLTLRQVRVTVRQGRSALIS